MAVNIWSLIVVGVAGISGWFAWRMWRTDKENAKLSIASANWSTVSGVINSASVHKEVSTNYDSNTNLTTESVTFEPRIEYGYTVSGKTYSGTRIAFARLLFINEEKANSVIAKYQVAASALVAYDPGNPQNSVLDRDAKPSSISLWTVILAVTTLVVAAVAVAMLFMSE